MMFAFHAKRETVRAAMTAHQARKTELVDAAWQLFARQGYDATSIAAIIEAVGISKGTFYHYFSSKADLLDAVVDRMGVQLLAGLRPLIDDPDIGALEKLSRLLLRSMEFKTTNLQALQELTWVMFRPENLRLRHEMQTKSLARTTPMVAAIIQQGVDEGTFDTAYPDETAELILELGRTMGEANAQTLLDSADEPRKLRRIERRLRVWMDAVERILGAPRGVLTEQNAEMVEAMSRTITAWVKASAAREEKPR